MTATMPDGLEYKNLAQACADAVGSTGVWGSEYPEEHGVRNHIVAVTGVRDEVGDIIVPGAFIKTLQRITPKACLGHDWNRAIGEPVAIEEVMPGDPRLPETDRFGRPWPGKAGALFARTRYNLAKKDGQDAYADAEFHGPRLATSIGYVDPKDDNGKPLHSYKAVDPDTGLMTRFLPELHLFEYSQVLHGAHLLAGGLKSGKPKKLERKQRPDMELKLRLVRDSAYWGLPLGTPIRPGMKPQGPKARRLVAAGQQADEGAGAVEVDANNLRVKPTAKGKQKGDVAVDEAYSGILGLIDRLGEHTGEDSEPLTPFNSTGFIVEDSFDNSINNGEDYNPLDILVANAIPPAEVEEDLRNADWDADRLGDAAERQDEIDSYIADVVDAYREKYNAELVRQNDTGGSEVAEPVEGSAEDTEVQPETAEEGVRTADLRVGSTFVNPDNGNVVTVEVARPSTRPGEMVVQGTDSEGGPFDAVLKNDDMLPAAPAEDTRTVNETAEDDKYQRAVERANAAQAATPTPGEARGQAQANRAASRRGELPLRRGESAPVTSAAPASAGPTRISAEDQAEVDRLKRDGRDNEAAKLYREAVQRAREAEGVTPEQISPTRARLRGQMDGQASPPSLEDGRTMQAAEPADSGETQAFELTGENGATLRVYSLRRPSEPGKPWAYDIITADGETIEGVGTYRSPGSALVRAEGEFHEAEAGNVSAAAEQDRLVPAAPEEPVSMPSGFDGSGPRQPGYAIPPPPADATEEVPVESGGQPGAEMDGEVGKFPDGTKPGPKLIALLGNAKWVTGYDTGDGNTADGWLATGHGNTVFTLFKKKIALGTKKGNSYLLTEEGARLMAPYLPNGGQRDDTETPAARDVLPGNETAVPGSSTEVVPEAPSGESTVEPGLAPDTAGEPFGETDPALAEAPLDEAAPESEPTGEITSDEIADTEEAVDASFGVTEAPDGEFEVDADIADRQDRVASLLIRSEAGSLDLSGSSDDQLRGTRADLVDEIRLQQHLERRRAGERALTRQQAEQQTADSLIPQEEADDTTAPEETGPKPRPGVAGAAEDLADALDDGDQARIDEATSRLRSSLNRSRSDSEVVAELRAMIDGPLDPTALRDAAERLREEQRAKRNEGARRRRAARRFERERLRALLSQVEAEMRNRDLDYDPLPDEDGTVTLDLGASASVTWSVRTEHEGWSGGDSRIEELSGSGYSADITTSSGKTYFSWTVRGDDGVVLAHTSGTAADPDSARAQVEIALDTQRRLGLIPIDAQIPQGSVPEHSSMTPLADVVGAIALMRERLDSGRRLNPITGQPDPFGDDLQPLTVPERSRFSDTGQVQKYLESQGLTTRGAGGQVRNVADTYRWDTAKMTPGGAFVVVDDLRGKPQVVHTVTGATFPPPLINGKGSLGRADLLRYATIAESIRDRDGNLVDWNQNARDLVSDIDSRSFLADRDGSRGLRGAVLDRLTREKIHDGQFTHALVQRDTTFADGVTNSSRGQYVEDQHHTLGQLINVVRGKPSAFDKKTIDIARGARTLTALGAPDAAAVLLTRRAAEVREQYGDAAPSHGAAVLDALATGYLGMFSPVRSHGERVRGIKAGERVFLSGDSKGDPLRSFRALAAPRRDTYSSGAIVPIIDEQTGEQRFLRISTNEFRIEDSEAPRYGHNPLSADLGGGRGAFAVVGPGEEPPATVEDLQARAFDDANVIPQDVLDAAAEALPESQGETAARRAAAPEGERAPRRRSPAAPKRTAQPPAAPEPVQGEQHLAQAQGRAQGTFFGMPFEYGGAPERGSFDSVEAVREHLAAQATDEKWRDNPQRASSAKTVVAKIDRGEMKLSPGGVFLVDKGGSVTHASSSFSVWPPNPNKNIHDDLHGGGYKYSQASSMRVARALESGVFDGEKIDWSGDGKAAIKQTNAISARNGKFHPIRTAQRVAYLDGILGTPKPTKTDVAMFRGMADVGADLDGPNPEAFDRAALLSTASEYSNSGGYTADSKKGAALVDRVNAELRLTQALAKTAPLDAVRRLTRLADELDGETVTMRIDPSFAQRMAVHGAKPDSVKALTPSDDLRKAAKMITDMYDPDKISESGRFRAAGMVGQVELTKPKITMGRSWDDPNGIAARRLESDINESGGIRFYRDENGLLHATFNNSAGVPIDITEGNFSVNGGQAGAIVLAPDGRLTLSYMSANRLVVIEARPSSWKFTPEASGNRDNDRDISGPENESPQVEGGAETDRPEDIGGGESPSDENEE